MQEIMNISGIECYEKEGTAYLKLETVARGLGFTQTAKSGNEVVRWERVHRYLSELGIPTCGDADFIPENIFYRLAMKAKNEAAEKFQAKIADEVIPAIRKTGGYVADESAFIATYLPFADENTKAMFGLTLAALRAANRKIAEDKPKVLFADAVSASHTSILVGELAKILNQNGVNIGQNRLFRWMRENKYLCAYGERYNMPTQQSMDRGLFEIKETAINQPDGSVRITRTVKVTGKGQQYFINQFLKEGEKANAEGKSLQKH